MNGIRIIILKEALDNINFNKVNKRICKTINKLMNKF